MVSISLYCHLVCTDSQVYTSELYDKYMHLYSLYMRYLESARQSFNRIAVLSSQKPLEKDLFKQTTLLKASSHSFNTFILLLSLFITNGETMMMHFFHNVYHSVSMLQPDTWLNETCVQ